MTKYNGKTFEQELLEAGIENVQIIERQNDAEWYRIRGTQTAFNRFIFNSDNENVQTLIKHLECYHIKKEHDGVTYKEKPHHDFSSHYADAFSAIKDAIDSGEVANGSSYGGQGRKRWKRKPKLKKYSPVH